jgi:two-component system sensor histidine kinase BaeS
MMPERAAPQQFRRRLRFTAVVVVVVWASVLALAVGVATGRFGDMGLPTDDAGRPRGLLVIAAAVAAAALATAVAYRRIGGPVGDLLHAAEQVADGDYSGVEVAVRGPHELRLLTATFNTMASQLAAGQEQRRRFLAEITHELRNPLTILQSEIEAQLDGVRPRDDRQLASLLDETRRLSHLVEDLHTLALAETGQLVLRREEMCVGDLIDDVVARHAATAERQQLALHTTLQPDLPTVWIDPFRIRQVLDDLLANALRHTPAGGDVTVAVTASEAGVTCEITDSGRGFPADQLATVFDRFTKSGDSCGSGLGLSIARDLVEAHLGVITATNHPAGGARVAFTIPASIPAPEPTSRLA